MKAGIWIPASNTFLKPVFSVLPFYSINVCVYKIYFDIVSVKEVAKYPCIKFPTLHEAKKYLCYSFHPVCKTNL